MPREVAVSLPITGMDCAECARSVEHEIRRLRGVRAVDVSFTAERATVRYDPGSCEVPDLVTAVERAGYRVVEQDHNAEAGRPPDLGRLILGLFGVVVGVVLFIVVLGEWFGVLDRITERVPWPLWLAGIGVGGYPVFRNVALAAVRGRIIAHTLMTVGALAAIAVGEWPTAAVVVFFMRMGEYVEGFTASKARGALRDLTSMLPKMATVEQGGVEREVPVVSLATGDVVVVRPGQRIPADGEVVRGAASVDQSAITGESMPVDVQPGDRVFAATIPERGSLHISVRAVGADSTFGRVIQLVEQSESQRASVQRVADRFATYYLPVVIGIAALTLLLRQDVLAMTAVLVVACSCSFALATPIAILASVGSAAKRGVLVKGGRYLETLAIADVILIDKTGTLTLGRPSVVDVVPLGGFERGDAIRLAAAAERESEHPLGRAIVDFARSSGIDVPRPDKFEALPGVGVRALVESRSVEAGSVRSLDGLRASPEVNTLEGRGQTVVGLVVDGQPAALFGLADELRPDAPGAVARLRDLGFTRIEMLTGDNERVAAGVASRLGIGFRAGLLPEDKIDVVRSLQCSGHRVVMIGDGVNDAPALAQADVGIALGVAGTDIAIEAAAVSLMSDDWHAVPTLFAIARRTMGVIRLNIGFAAVYNLAGLSLAAFGVIPPVIAAAAQSIPDIGILANSSRLLRSPNDQAFPAGATSPDTARAEQPAHGARL